MIQVSRSRQRLGFLIFLLGFMVVLLVNYISEGKVTHQRKWRGRQKFRDQAWAAQEESFNDQAVPSWLNSSLRASSFAVTTADDSYFYGVMFDAGSTGSRVHVFHFISEGNKPPKLIDELYNYTNVGLSTFAKKPEEGAASLKPLLDAALDFIPADEWSSSPVALKATAGLRLLPKDEAEALLESVYQLFCDSPLHVEVKEKSITIMEGTMEGIYIWFTINFLLGALGSPESTPTVGALDLGGGSTQITFVPQDTATIIEGHQRNFIETFRFLHNTFQVYSHSYLGLGLREARLQIMKMEQGLIDEKNSTIKDHFFYTSCLPPNTTQTWSFGESTYTAQSAMSDTQRVHHECYSATKKYIKGMKVHAPSEVKHMNFYAMSYFWGRARDLKLVDEHVGGILTVDEIIQASKNVCQRNDSQPFICMDMVFISTLLTKGYRFPGYAELQVCPTIGGFDVSWALGATIDLLHTHWDHLSEGS